jgi:hypothetical protein
MGRPRKEINKKSFERLCSVQCTEEDVCDILEVSDKTLNAWCRKEYGGKTFSEVFAQKRKSGIASLRSAGFKHAIEDGGAVLIFHLKNYCGMSDNPQSAIDTEDSGAYFEAAGLDDDTADD